MRIRTEEREKIKEGKKYYNHKTKLTNTEEDYG
jgi:hypothetical protein